MDTLLALVNILEKKKKENRQTDLFHLPQDDLIDELAQEAVDKTSILFQAIKPKGGEMPVVMGAGGSGILLHEAIGHAFEADFNRKNTSIFSD